MPMKGDFKPFFFATFVLYTNVMGMTTLIIDIKNSNDARKIADALRLIKGVTRITIEEEKPFERIPGLPYTDEECIASIRQAEEDIDAGRTIPHTEVMEKMRQKIQTWK